MKNKQAWFYRPEIIAIVTAFVFGLLVHMFSLTNVLHNGDDINVQPQGVGSTLGSGRWLLFLLSRLGEGIPGNYNLPWVNGFLFILLLSVAAGFVVSIYNIKSITASMLMSAAMVSFPSVTCTLFFKFTSPQYGLGIIFAVTAVWVLAKWRYGFPISALLCALSMGIYQAFFPFIVSIILLLLIQYSLQKDSTLISIIKRGFYYLSALVAGLALYFLILKIMLKVEQLELLDYQGISSMGNISLLEMPRLILKAIKEFLLLPFRDYCNLATSPLLRWSYLLLGIVSIIIGCLLIIQNRKNIWETLAIVLLCFLFPLGVNLIVLMGATYIYANMLYSFVTVLFAPFVLLDLFSPKKMLLDKVQQVAKVIIGVIVSVIILLNSYFANVNYTAMYYANRQVENFYNSISTQVHLTEGYDLSKKWAFIGYANNTFFNRSDWAGEHYYGTNVPAAALINQYSGKDWVYNYLGHFYRYTTQAEIDALAQMPEVQEMPFWPNYGSIKIIDDYVVIKLSS